MDFYNKVGKGALGSRLRRLSESLTEQAFDVYALYQTEMQPKWFPVFYALATGEEKPIMQIAAEIGHSHPSVSIIVKEMVKAGVAETSLGKSDGRKNYVKLTAKGDAVNERLKIQYADVNAAVETALDEGQYNLWKAIEEWEFLLEQKSLFDRVRSEKKIRESKSVRIVEYTPEYKTAFKQLNEEWISAFFKMEEEDYRSLDNPQEYIIDKGGYILIALDEGRPVGTCALIPEHGGTYELAKMAVTPKAKGKGIGYLLGLATIDKAREIGAERLRLGSNTSLKPALNLYQKLGFKKINGEPSPYERCNIQMELKL